MQFSDTTNKTGLVEDVDFRCGTDSTSYPLADKARNMNRWYYKAVVAGIKANRTWQFDDSNYNTFPISTTTMVDGQNDYELPTTLLKIHAVEVKDASGNWHRLSQLDFADMPQTVTDFETTSGLPRFYDILGDSLWLEAAPSTATCTLTAGLKIYYSREMDAFSASDTTQEPGIPEAFHAILSLGATFDWLLTHGEDRKSAGVRAEISQLLMEYQNLNSARDEQVKISVKSAHRQRDYF